MKRTLFGETASAALRSVVRGAASIVPRASFGLQILVYHSVDDNPADAYATHPRDFYRQMHALRRHGWQVVPLRDAVERRVALAGRKVVALTFDDGARDFMFHALPVLEEFGFPATMFVPTSLVGGVAAWRVGDLAWPLLSWDELSLLLDRGVDVGSHGSTHRRFTTADDQTLREESHASLVELRRRLPHAIKVLAYPYGEAGPRECAAARDAGYVAALCAPSRFGNFPWTNAHGLRRGQWGELVALRALT